MSSPVTREWITVQEYADALRISVRTATRWAASDPNMRVQRIGPSGRLIRIHRSELHRCEKRVA